MATLSPSTGSAVSGAPGSTGATRRTRPTWRLLAFVVALAVVAIVTDIILLSFMRSADRILPSAVLPAAPQLTEMRSLAAANPRDKELHLVLAQSYLKIAHYLSAKAEFDTAMANGADETMVRTGRTRAEIALQRYDLAEQDLRRLIAKSPKQLDLYLTLADTLQAADENSSAAAVLRSVPLGADGLPAVEGDRLASAELLATAYSQLQDWKTSLDLIDRTLKLDPNRLGSVIEKGKALHALGRRGEAIPYLEKGIASAPKAADLQYLLGTAYQSRGAAGDLDRSFACFRKAVAADPVNGPAVLAFAKECDRRHERKTAAFAYLRAYTLGMEGWEPLLRSGDLMIELGNKEEGWFRRGRYFESTKQYEKALAEYTKLSTSHPCCRSGFLHMARVYNVLQMSSRAVACLEKAQRLDPKRAKQLRWSLVQALGGIHEERRQAAILNELIAEGGSDAIEASYHMAVHAEGAGMFDEAESWMAKCLAASPKDPVYHVSVGKLMLVRRTAKGKLDSAIQHLETAFHLAPDNYEACYYLGLCYNYAGRVEDAILALRHAEDLQPESGEGYQALIQALQRGGRKSEAADLATVFDRFEQFKQAREIVAARCKREPHNAIARKNKADFHMRAHEAAAAIDEYKLYLAQKPDDRQARARLAEALSEMGRRDEQRTQLAILAGAKPPTISADAEQQ